MKWKIAIEVSEVPKIAVVIRASYILLVSFPDPPSTLQEGLGTRLIFFLCRVYTHVNMWLCKVFINCNIILETSYQLKYSSFVKLTDSGS